jgi:hypothetical protein
VLVESFHKGEDLRLIVIGFKLVAAAIRRPAEVVGNGRDTVRQLIERQSRRRAAATGGESRIPLDARPSAASRRPASRWTTCRPKAPLPGAQGRQPPHRRHHPRRHRAGASELAEAAIRVARAIDIPVVGVDFIVKDPTEPDYVFIEANERPGLANHEPQPTAQRFIDLLFPLSMPAGAPDRLSGGLDDAAAPDRHRLSEGAARSGCSPSPAPPAIPTRSSATSREELERLGVPFSVTRRGAILALYRGREVEGARAIVAHLDTLGATVKMIKDNGRLELVPIGTWSARAAEYCRCTIFTDEGAFRGTILPLKASGHTFNEEVDTQPVGWPHIEVRIDADCYDRKSTEALGIHIGDFVAIDPGTEFLDNGYIVSRHLDDKAGCAVMLAALKAMVDGQVADARRHPLHLHDHRGSRLGRIGGAARQCRRDGLDRQRHHRARGRTAPNSA